MRRALTIFLFTASTASAQIANITFRQPVTSEPIHPRFVLSSGDGTVYYSDHAVITDRFIARLERNGAVTKFPYPCAACTAGTEAVAFLSMTFGPDGNIWVPVQRGRAADTTPLESAIVRITPSGVHTIFPLSNPAAFFPSGFGHSAITRGPDGNLWFTENNANRIGRITPAGQITEFDLPNANSSPTHIIAGPDGALWFTEAQGSRIGRITTSGAITEFSIQFTGTNIPRAHDITVGSDGNLWVTMEFGGPPGNNVTRVTPAGVMTAFPFPRFNFIPQHIVPAGDGNLYFTNSGTTSELGRVNLTGIAKGLEGQAEPVIQFQTVNSFGTDQRLFDIAVRYDYVPRRIFMSSRTGVSPNFVDQPIEGLFGPGTTSLATTRGNQNSSGETNDPISTSSGELYKTTPPDLVLRGPLPVIFQRYYGSRIAFDGAIRSALGTNWLHNYDWVIRSLAEDGTRVGVVNWQGREHRFVRSGPGWVLEAPLDVPVQLVQTATGFVFGDPLEEMVYTFNNAGRLTKIEDTRGNALTLSYVTANLASVTDGLGRTLTFTYDSANHLTAVSDGTRTVRFTHSGDLLATVADALSNVTTYTYNAAGQLLSTRLPRGNVAYAQAYSNEGRVVSQTTGGANTTSIAYTAGQTSITDPAGGVVVHNYNTTAGGELTRFTDHANRQVTLGYDSAGRRTSVVDRLGFTTGVTHDPASGKPSAVTLADGTRYSFTYGSRVFNGITLYPLTKVTFPDGTSETYGYDPNGNIATLVDQLSRNWTFVHDPRGQLLTATNPAGGVLTNTFHPDGALASTRDSDTGATTFAYDGFGRMVRTTHPDQSFVELTWDANDRVTAFRDERGNTATAQYDANDNLIRATDPGGAPAAFEYDNVDRMIRSTDRIGGVRLTAFDARDLPANVTDPNNLRTTFGFDSRRRMEVITDPAGKASRLGYDDEAEVLSVTNPLNQTARRTVNALGLTTSVIDPLGRTVTLERDQLNRVTAVREALSRSTVLERSAAGEVTGVTRSGLGTMRLEYNNLGLMNALTDFRGNRWTRTFTSVGRLATATDPLGRAIRYGYDALGRPSNIIFPDAGTLDITRDAAGNTTRLNYSGGPDLQYRYDANNRLLEADRVIFTRDAEGRIVSANVDAGFDVRATYDPAGRMTRLAYGTSGSVSYTWDSRDNLIVVSDTFTNTQTSFTYDDANRLITINRPNGVNTTYTYNAAGQPVRIQHGNLIDLQYTYNAAGQILEETSTGTLDPAALPAAVFEKLATPQGIFDEGHSFTWNAANEVSSPGYQHDQRGRRTLQLNAALRWDGKDRMTGVNNTTVIWTGLDTLRTIDTGLAGGRTGFITGYQIPGTPPIVTADTGGRQSVFFFNPKFGNFLYGATSEGQAGVNAFFPLFDVWGDTRAVTGISGGVFARYEHEPGGLVVAEEGTHPNPYRYGGGWGAYYGREINSYITGKTVYDPQTQAGLTTALPEKALIKENYALYADQLLSGSTITDGGGAGEQYLYGYFTDFSEPSPENVAEFRVLAQRFDAEYGRNQGAILNVITRDRANDFHGNLYSFNRSKALNANTFFNNAAGRSNGDDYLTSLYRLTFRRDFKTGSEFGGPAGPIVRDRRFLFLGPGAYTEEEPVNELIGPVVYRGGYSSVYAPFSYELPRAPFGGDRFLKGDHSSSTRSSNEFLGLQQQSSKRFSNGFGVQANYSFSKIIDNSAPLLEEGGSDELDVFFSTWLRFGR
jgi:YD repeat-containing protein